jgi:hypothetical protein
MKLTQRIIQRTQIFQRKSTERNSNEQPQQQQTEERTGNIAMTDKKIMTGQDDDINTQDV